MDILNLGAGRQLIKGAVNHDLVKREEIDIAWDLNCLPWPWADESFDYIEARAVFEHLRHRTLLEVMDEAWRILRPGGSIYVKLPYWDAEVSYNDPTHCYVVGLGIFDIFDPDTQRGEYYYFYTERKWKIDWVGFTNTSKTSVGGKLVKRVGSANPKSRSG